jgi:hypothetical protein
VSVNLDAVPGSGASLPTPAERRPNTSLLSSCPIEQYTLSRRPPYSDRTGGGLFDDQLRGRADRHGLNVGPRSFQHGGRPEPADDQPRVVEETHRPRPAARSASIGGPGGTPARSYLTVRWLLEDPHLVAVTVFRHDLDPSEGQLLQIPAAIVVDGADDRTNRAAAVTPRELGCLNSSRPPYQGPGSDRTSAWSARSSWGRSHG